MTPIPFIGPSNPSASPNYSSRRCINLMLEAGRGKAPGVLIGTPGMGAPFEFLNASTYPGATVRGMFDINGADSIVVLGGEVYRMGGNANAVGNTQKLGDVLDDGLPAHITTNGIDIVVLSGGSLYSVTLSGTTAALLMLGVSSVDVIDDHFVATMEGTANFVWSDVLSTTFDPLSIQATNGSPDTLVALKVARRTIYMLGTKAIEQWYDAGGADIPFARIDGGVFEVGCLARNSIGVVDSIFWLGAGANGGAAVWTMSGGAPQKVSTPSIEHAISLWPDPSDAEAVTYSQEGHAFYMLSSVSGDQTWVYDISTGEWHQRAYRNTTSGVLERIIPRCHMWFAGKNLVGSRDRSTIYEYSQNAYIDREFDPLPSIIACEIIQDGLEQQKTMSFQLDMDAGVGLNFTTFGVGMDPQAMLRTSRDGGMTWSNALWRSFGKIGEYSKRVIWRRVGGGRRMVFEVTITDPVPRRITGAYVG